MKNNLIGFLALSAGAMSCQSPPGEPRASGMQGAELSSAARKARAVPKPIPGGDFFPDSPHHRAGIIHQFYPIPTALGGDGPWADPNGMTDFNGFVAQVFMGGTAVDDKGNHYIVDVDNRVYQGEYIGRNGELAWGTFCEI
jgi:hypothetical protein